MPPNSDNAPAPSLMPSDLVPARTSCKRPHDVAVNKPPSVLTLNDDCDGVLNSKKAKTQARPDTDTDTGMHSDVEVMDIDDVDDPHDETLNKTDPTADIKAFFTALPRVPGQAKQRMSCNLCAQGLGCVKQDKILTNEHTTFRRHAASLHSIECR
ncbi:hypothetical protein EDB92DRAFT_1894562 [Lactarius akahatsu]|uniref:Uncharacterized protein n=1 Tax=Lactarius akahatsu TaxID=416441 RepID=A0AAD4L8U7_9AGAM|nr:hypothetical protein EDB92DRAFT_1894562 [Lactarius akahatsu]